VHGLGRFDRPLTGGLALVQDRRFPVLEQIGIGDRHAHEFHEDQI
jgi:hypothetical protein